MLQRMDFHPSRTLGQNFLVDENILRLLVEAAAIRAEDIVLEVGSGLGVLTSALLERAGRVIAIEKDDRLAGFLRKTIGDAATLDLRHGDIMSMDLEALLSEGVTRVAANLPYGIASRLLVDLMASERRPARIVVTVQKEVADRMAAAPGGKTYGVLSLFSQLDYDVKRTRIISPSCYWPRPKVDSAIVELSTRTVPEVALRDPAVFRRLVKHAFSLRRKQMGTVLQRAPARWGCGKDVLDAVEIDPRRRPETVSLSEWCRLANELNPI